MCLSLTGDEQPRLKQEFLVLRLFHWQNLSLSCQDLEAVARVKGGKAAGVCKGVELLRDGGRLQAVQVPIGSVAPFLLTRKSSLSEKVKLPTGLLTTAR